MMAIDTKRLNEATLINLDRCFTKSDRVMQERMIDDTLLSSASSEGECRWYALRVSNRSEVDLRDSLLRIGIDAVVPTKTVQAKARRAGARGKIIHKPVLRNLVFVRMVSSNEAFAGLLRVNGIEAFIGTGERPHPISDKEMNDFMDLAQKGAFDERNMPTGLVVGSRVKIGVGAYADFEGVLEGYARSRSARVLTYLFGREMTIDVKLAHLEKLE